jgi:HlyD family secretion protein
VPSRLVTWWKKGDLLFSLDGRDLRAELQVRQTQLLAAQAKLKKPLESPRPEEVPAAEARVHEAEAALRDAEVQDKLMEAVRDRRAIREEDLERRRIAVSSAQAKLEQAKADLALLNAGEWAADVEIARAEVAEAQRQIGRTEADLSRLIVTAPINSEILQCKIHVGEYAQAGPLQQPLMFDGRYAASQCAGRYRSAGMPRE